MMGGRTVESGRGRPVEGNEDDRTAETGRRIRSVETETETDRRRQTDGYDRWRRRRPAEMRRRRGRTDGRRRSAISSARLSRVTGCHRDTRPATKNDPPRRPAQSAVTAVSGSGGRGAGGGQPTNGDHCPDQTRHTKPGSRTDQTRQEAAQGRQDIHTPYLSRHALCGAEYHADKHGGHANGVTPAGHSERSFFGAARLPGPNSCTMMSVPTQ